MPHTRCNSWISSPSESVRRGVKKETVRSVRLAVTHSAPESLRSIPLRSRALNDEPEIRYGNYGPDLLDQVTSIGEKLEGQAGFLNEWASRVRE